MIWEIQIAFSLILLTLVILGISYEVNIIWKSKK